MIVECVWIAVTSTTVCRVPRFLLALGVFWTGVGPLGGNDPPSLVLQGAAVFDAAAGQFNADQTVVIEGNRIRSVSSAETAPSADARVLDCRGKFVLPGLIDAHVHLVHLANRTHVTGDQLLPLFLANGVTSVRDAGDEIIAESVIARSAELRPDICPRVFLTSPLIDSDPPLHRDIGYRVSTSQRITVRRFALWVAAQHRAISIPIERLW